MHYKFIWYCFLVIFANTLLHYLLTIDFTGRIKKKTSTSTGSSEFVAAPESGQALPLSPSSVSRVQVAPCLFVVVCMFCYLILLVCMQCMLLCACDCHLTGWFAQPTAVALQHRRHRRHKGQFAPGLFRVVCMFHPLILLVCM